MKVLAWRYTWKRTLWGVESVVIAGGDTYENCEELKYWLAKERVSPASFLQLEPKATPLVAWDDATGHVAADGLAIHVAPYDLETPLDALRHYLSLLAD